MKIVRRILVAFVVLILLAVIGVLSYRAVWQHRIVNATKITSPNGIEEEKFIDVNGAQEWVAVRGENKNNPIILFLHGGPSEANSPLVSLYTPYEKDFVFVQWDQPGAGKTFIKAGDHQPKLALESMAADGISVAEYLRGEFHQPKIVLIGEDWGSLLGERMIEKRPDLFTAFIGTDTAVSWVAKQQVEYDYTKNRATSLNDRKTLEALQKLGPPPYLSLDRYRQFPRLVPPEDDASIKRLIELVFRSPRLSLTDMFGWYKALRSGEEELTPVLISADMRKADTKFAVPVFFIEGENNIVSPTSLVSDYVSKIQAPVKKLQIVPGASYFVIWAHPAEFLNFLREDLRLPSAKADVTN
jgi:pimeloyl-ACP methyl ester carboxylesterase